MSSEARGIQSIEVGSRLLQVLVNASQPMMLRDLAGLADIAPAQAHAYLASYRRIELIEQDASTSRYRLGPFAMRLGMTRMRSDHALEAAGAAAAELSAELSTTVAVVVWGCGAPTVIQVHAGPHELNLNMRHGTVFGVTNTFSGRVFAAYMDTDAMRVRIEEEFSRAGRFEGGHEVTRSGFEEAVADARRKGYAAGMDIAVPGDAAIAAPVLDGAGRPLFVLTLIDSKTLLDVDPQGAPIQTLLAKVRELGRSIAADERPPKPIRSREVVQNGDRDPSPSILASAATDKRGVHSIEVGGRLLQALIDAEEPMMLRHLARSADVAPAQAHPYLVSFRKQGLIEQDSHAGRYRIGPFALLLGIARMRSFDPLHMAGNALAQFAQDTGFTVSLSVWGTHGPTVLQVHEGIDTIYTKTRPGFVYSISGTANGRLFSAFMPESLIKSAMDRENAEGPGTKRVGRPIPYRQLKPLLREVRDRGLAIAEPPPVPGISALSAPVFDHLGQIQMAVTLYGPADRFDTSDAGPTATRLLAFVRSLSAQLGYAQPRERRAALDELPADRKRKRSLVVDGKQKSTLMSS